VQFSSRRHLLAGSLYRPNLPGRRPQSHSLLARGHRIASTAAPGLHSDGISPATASSAWPGTNRASENQQATSTRRILRTGPRETLARGAFPLTNGPMSCCRVGLWGHSPGGMVAPPCASRSEKVAFGSRFPVGRDQRGVQDGRPRRGRAAARRFAAADIEEATAFAIGEWISIRGPALLRN